jgi:hypothetical protein
LEFTALACEPLRPGRTAAVVQSLVAYTGMGIRAATVQAKHHPITPRKTYKRKRRGVHPFQSIPFQTPS